MSPELSRTAAPLALDRTRGAFYQGLRLTAIDGVCFDIPDTPPNAAAFGRPVTRRYGELVDGGYPQIHGVFLSETGTHLIVRVLEYTFDDPKRPGHGERHRWVTTLLDAPIFPAIELVVLYQERWEIEIYQSYCLHCHRFYDDSGLRFGLVRAAA